MKIHRPCLSILADIRAGILPRHCALCQQTIKSDQTLCFGCETDLPWALRPCEHCGAPLPPETEEGACGSCLQHTLPWSTLIAPCLYQWPITELVTRYKYKGDLQAGQVLAVLLGQQIIERYAGKMFPDLLIPVPLHWRRRWQRGFNQSEWLAFQIIRYWRSSAEATPEQKSLEIANKICRRVRFTPNQQGLTKQQRRVNLTGAFEIRTELKNKSVALLDDVVTTGSTVLEISHLLTRAGVANIDIWCLCRTAKH